MGGFSAKLLFTSAALMVITFAVLPLVSSTSSSYSAVSYKVGDDVIEWSSSNRTFHVGETISFEYDHNELYHQHVVQVTPTAYQLCDVTSPIAVFTTGNDSITFNNTGYYYFIFGPGTCVQEQMLDIYVQPEENYENHDDVSVAPTLAPAPALAPAAVSLSSSSSAASAAASSKPNPAAASSNPNPAAASYNPNPSPNDDLILYIYIILALFFLFMWTQSG